MFWNEHVEHDYVLNVCKAYDDGYDYEYGCGYDGHGCDMEGLTLAAVEPGESLCSAG